MGNALTIVDSITGHSDEVAASLKQLNNMILVFRHNLSETVRCFDDAEQLGGSDVAGLLRALDELWRENIALQSKSSRYLTCYQD